MENKKLIFYVVRHGKTLFNKFNRMQGYCDSPLIDDGIETAKDLAFRLRDIEFTAAYSSTSERAIDTAKIILNGRNVNLITDKGLKEMFYGDLEGEKEEIVELNIQD